MLNRGPQLLKYFPRKFNFSTMVEMLNIRSLKVWKELEIMQKKNNLKLSSQQHEQLASIANLGWSSMQTLPQLKSDSDNPNPKFPFLYTNHMSNAGYSFFTEKKFIERIYGQTRVRIIFKAKEITQTYLNQMKDNQESSPQAKENHTFMERTLDERHNKGDFVESSANWAVVITKTGQHGGIVYECMSNSGFIDICSVMNIKEDELLKKIIWLDPENKERLKCRGPEFVMLDDVTKMALTDLLWSHGLNQDVAKSVENLSSECYRQAMMEFYDGAKQYFSKEIEEIN
jgi:hypothetical protein